MEYNSS